MLSEDHIPRNSTESLLFTQMKISQEIVMRGLAFQQVGCEGKEATGRGLLSGKHFGTILCFTIVNVLFWASLVAQMVKTLPAIQEIQVRSLGQEDPLEKGMATHSSILVWRIPWTEEPVGSLSTGSQRAGHV